MPRIIRLSAVTYIHDFLGVARTFVLELPSPNFGCILSPSMLLASNLRNDLDDLSKIAGC